MDELINLPEDGIEEKEVQEQAPNQAPNQEAVQEQEEALAVEQKPKAPKIPKAPRAPKTGLQKIQSKFVTQPTTSIGWLCGYSMEEGQITRNAESIKVPRDDYIKTIYAEEGDIHTIFTYTPEGDLQVGPLFTGEVTRVIPVQRVQSATVEYTVDFFKTRAATSKAQEETYVQVKRDLKRIVLLYKAGGATVDEVLNANMQVAIEERKLTEIIKEPRKISRALGAIESGLTMNTYDKGVLINPVSYASYTSFPTESIWMPAPEPEVAVPQPLPLRQLGGSDSNPADKPKRQYTAQQIAIIRSRMARK
jgi:hypothetical protein